MKIKGLKLLVLFLLIGFGSFAQEVVRGEVKDKVSGEGVYGALVKVNGTPKARTDFEGTFTLKLAEGKYTLTISNVNEGYIDEDVEIEVIAGNVLNLPIEIGKSKSVQDVTAVKVKGVKTVGPATTLKGSDKKRMEQTSTSDGLPKETIDNSGVTDAADAVAMVPAASVENGKNVYVRGLGDRYTKTILNGMDIPGLDPDRNSVQMDIFPAVLIDNITVYKTFTPNLTADFTGGLIDIQTKDFPGRKTIYAKAGWGYNTNATFNPDFISYQGGKMDFLGFDDGGRGLPISPSASIPNPAAGDQLTSTFTKKFGDVMATEQAMSFLNQSYAFALGNQINKPRKKDSLKNLTYGYNVALNYRTNNRFFKDVEYNEYLRDTDSTQTELFRDRTSKGQLATKDVMWTGLVGQSIKWNKSKLSLVLFHTQNGSSSAANLTETNYDSNQATLVKQGLQYSQRSISNVNLSGLHYLDSASRWKLNWKVSPTYSRISDPDIRSTAMELSDTPDANGDPVYLFEESVGAEVRRIFRSLNEYNVSAKMDINYKFMQWDSLESNLSFGVLNTYKNRTFDVNEYIFRATGISNVVPNDPDWFFEDENIWTPESDSGIYAVGQQEKANLYSANQNITAAYIMNELPLAKSFDITYGARLENNVNRYTGQSNNADTDPNAPRYDNEVVLDKLNILPSINMVYKIRKDEDSLRAERSTNFRGAYTQTLARPSFREISISQIYDPIQGRRYLGNIDLKQTLIHNADLRWEHFFGRTEIISVSGFYKKFINPIEIVANIAAPNEFKPVNAGEADVFGAEFELRKAIGFKSKPHINFVVGTNFTYVSSRVDMNAIVAGKELQLDGSVVDLTEKEMREKYAEEGETIGDYRQMYGQAPYIVNAFANFKHDSLHLMVNITYNVQGKKLAVIGVGLVPDVYEQPFHNLNLKVSKGFGKIHKGESVPRWKVSVRAQNILGSVRQKFYEAYNAESQVFEYLDQGMTISGSIAFTIK